MVDRLEDQKNAECTTLLNDTNRKAMKRCVVDYVRSTGLTRAEQAGLWAIAGEARNKPILDLGVGAGRTARPLMSISRNYIGADCVPEMVATCRKRFTNARFVQADARNLSQFEDNSFFLIVFSLNGICMVDHEGRMAILKEVFRLLKPGGAFLFSSYNRNSSNYESFFRFPGFRLTTNPFRLVVRGFRFHLNTGISVVNRIRLKRLEQRCDEYSIINDACHNYSVMLYYTSLENHYNQLRSTGFGDVRAFDLAGQTITSSTRDNSVLFLARKPRGQDDKMDRI
jgi:ubiquinone/menaquinone biosynthesis C-methylase UbiE